MRPIMGLTYSDILVIRGLLRGMENRMTAREDASWSALSGKIDAVKEGWAALQAENANLKQQLADANVDFQAQLDADSEADATKVDAAESALDELVPDAAPEPETPADV